MRPWVPSWLHESKSKGSGHDAGYQWAQDHSITNPDECGGNSQSFREGCLLWVKEQKDSENS